MSEYVKVATTNQLLPGHSILVKAKGQEIALYNVAGTYYAIGNTCPHSKGPLAEGRLFGTVVTCPWHGSQFNVTTGQCQGGPASSDVATYPVRVEGHTILIQVK